MGQNRIGKLPNPVVEISPEMETSVMHVEPEDTGHSGMRFRTMGRGTHGISSTETAADMSGFVTHIGFPIVQAETRSFSCTRNASGLPYIATPKHLRLTET